jgi:hypothetical protein
MVAKHRLGFDSPAPHSMGKPHPQDGKKKEVTNVPRSTSNDDLDGRHCCSCNDS